MMRSFAAALLVCLALTGAATAADWGAGKKLYDAGDYAAALREWVPLSQGGDTHADYGIGIMLLYGRGLDRDPVAAAAMSTRAAGLGEASAAYALGVMYEDGNGVVRNVPESVRLYHQAAQAGNADAQNNLGTLYATGAGVPMSRAQAHFWFTESAALGNGEAAANRDRIAKQLTREEFAESERLMFDMDHAGVMRPAAGANPPEVERAAAEIVARIAKKIAPPPPPPAIPVAEVPVVPPAPPVAPARPAAGAPAAITPRPAAPAPR